MGSCSQRHDDFFKRQLMVMPEEERHRFEKDYIDETIRKPRTHSVAFEKQISLIDDKIKKAMAKNEQPHNQYDRIPSEVQERIDKIDSDIKKMNQQSEYLGDAGKIEEFERTLIEIEQLRANKAELMKMAENPTMIAKQQKVCDICGAVQAMNDTARRDETHLNGKIHLGFKKLREELKNLQKRREVLKLIYRSQKMTKREDGGAREASSSHKNDPRDPREAKKEPVKEEKVTRRDRSREKEKESHKRREDGDRERRTSRDRHRDKSRDRSKERHKDRHHDDRKRDRSRSSDRKKSKRDKKRRSSRSRS